MYRKFVLPLAVAILFKVTMTVQLRKLMQARIQISQESSGDPAAVWPVRSPAPVHMAFEDTTRYAIDGPNSDAEWSSLAPDQGLIYLGDEHRVHSIAMFHELRCLNVIRRAMVRKADGDLTVSSTPLVRHCLNYVRQMIFCRSDTMLNGYAYNEGHLYTLPGTNRCDDWTEIYEEVEKNQDAHRRWMDDRRRA